MSTLALGTAQFGLDYGVKNKRGRVPLDEAKRIIALAAASGVDTIDTAAAYGESEDILGCIISKEMDVRIVSKMPAKPIGSARTELEKSLARLGRQNIYGYLLHSFSTYEENPGIMLELVECKKQGLVNKIGFSLYKPEQAFALLKAEVPLDLVQVPYNLLDRRFESVFPLLKERGVEIHVRSIFLQGLFFIPSEQLASHFSQVREKICRLQWIANESGFGIASLCLGFAAASPIIDRIVIGVDGLDDFRQNIEAWKKHANVQLALTLLGDIGINDEQILLPFNWK